MKVEVFGGNDLQILEDCINDWLMDLSNIRIHFITQSSDAGTPDKVGYTTIAIWYTEDKK